MSIIKTIKEQVSGEIIEKKSKFIANVFCVETANEAEEKIKEIKNKYYDAKHNCFAYLIMGENNEIIKKASDDGEPSGTAGLPILQILEKRNLSNILVIVTRYFGGILLGTGGLLRAYSDATINALDKAKIIEKTLGLEIIIETTYKDVEQVKYYLEKQKTKITNVNYQENVELLVEIPEETKDIILKNIQEKIIKYEIKTKKYIGI